MNGTVFDCGRSLHACDDDFHDPIDLCLANDEMRRFRYSALATLSMTGSADGIHRELHLSRESDKLVS